MISKVRGVGVLRSTLIILGKLSILSFHEGLESLVFLLLFLLLVGRLGLGSLLFPFLLLGKDLFFLLGEHIGLLLIEVHLCDVDRRRLLLEAKLDQVCEHHTSSHLLVSFSLDLFKFFLCFVKVLLELLVGWVLGKGCNEVSFGSFVAMEMVRGGCSSSQRLDVTGVELASMVSIRESLLVAFQFQKGLRTIAVRKHLHLKWLGNQFRRRMVLHCFNALCVALNCITVLH